MRQILLLAIISQCIISLQSLPLPSDQIINYRVSSKYFNRPNGVTSPDESPNSLYSLLTQIHYGSKSDGDNEVAPTSSTIQKDEIINNIDAVEAEAQTEMESTNVANELPETASTMIDVTEHQLDSASEDAVIEDNSDNGESITAELIEKVIKEQIKDANNAETNTEQNDQNIFDNTEMTPNEDEATQATIIHNAEDDKKQQADEEEETSTSTVIESVEIDGKTEEKEDNADVSITTTSQTETISNDYEHEASQSHNEMEQDKVYEEADDNKIPESLLNAVGDLLSSVLGISVSKIDNGIFLPSVSSEITTTETITDEPQTEVEEFSSESPAETSDSSENSENVNENNEKPNEVDLKIENLANVQQTSFITEDTPEIYTETIKEAPTQAHENDDDNDDGVLEVLSALTEADEAIKPVSFDESVNHVMNLVKSTEGRIELETAQNIVDSILIDNNMRDSNLDHIAYGTLKEMETNLGLSEEDNEKDSGNTANHEREEMMKNFETDINESLANLNPYDYENFTPNTAKAALHYKYQFDDDF